jgi:hydroxypyruvate reductase
LGLGKAACGMAQGAAEGLRVEFSGVLATHELTPHPRGLDVFVGDHPIPSVASARAGQALLDAARATQPEDFALFLVSGGGSAIAALPVEGLSMADVAATTAALLHSGASIDEINTVRAHLTQLGGGRLAASCRANHGLVLMLSDIASGQLSTLASGPTLANATSPAEALGVIERSGALVPSAVIDSLRRAPIASPSGEDVRSRRRRHRVLATPHTLAEEARCQAETRGLTPHVVASAFDGDFESLASLLVERAREISSDPSGQPTLLIASGEPRLNLPTERGSGGRMQQLALTLAHALAGRDVCALCAGSDGRDGSTAFAGARIDGSTSARAQAMGIDLALVLERFDATPAVRSLGVGIDRFQSATNLTDLALVLLWPSRLERSP